MAHIDRDLISNKPNCYVFDIDGCMADIQNILLLHNKSYEVKLEKYKQDLEAYKLAMIDYEKARSAFNHKEIEAMPVEPIKPKEPKKPDAKQAKQIDWDYFREHLEEAIPIPGVIDLFVTMARSHKVVILTGRDEYMQPNTIAWLRKVIIEKGGDNLWRDIYFQVITRVGKERDMKKSEFKLAKIQELSKNYNIPLIIEDHPITVEKLTKAGFTVLMPGKGYYDVKEQ